MTCIRYIIEYIYLNWIIIFFFSQFPTEDDVLMGARHIVAMQIAHDPLVRQCIRSAYFERAKIKVKPTKKGMKVSGLMITYNKLIPVYKKFSHTDVNGTKL